MKWNLIESHEDWLHALERSNDVPVVVLKHSTRCSVSFMAKKNFEAKWDEEVQKAEPYFLDLIRHRDISNAIAEYTGVRHESPQMILIRKGKAILNASHYGVDPEALLTGN